MAWLYYGGNGSSYQLLRFWVTYPEHCAGALALPYHAEQTWNAQTLQRLGVVTDIQALHATDLGALRPALAARSTATTPAPPADLAAELARYADAPQHVAQAVLRWYPS